MNHDLHETLTAQFSTYHVLDQLHAVPPHGVYEIVVEGQHAVYKCSTDPTGKAEIEGRITALIGEHTTIPVPEILSVGDDHYIAAWHPDAPAPYNGQAVDNNWSYAAGRLLATLHNETPPFFENYGRFAPTENGISVVGSTEWQTAAIEYIQRHQPILAKYGHGDIADAVINVFTDRPGAFDGAGGVVCCHGWATPDHVAVDDGEAVCVLDFEHTIAAPGEFNYWRTVLPTFRNEPIPEKRFTPVTLNTDR
ncbi:phosphotransferase [Halalkalicoccus tibetensis]|uniref:Phosphotransferase n=1 Tax=Halalkalicoccus tibetensis TaxID=175632 RepID=A0ABD5V6P2_9EURY